MNITVHLCTKEEMQEAVKKAGFTLWYHRFIRGFCYPHLQEIWIVKDCAGELALLAHEWGHLRGLNHCVFPSIMNFSGVFRWFAFHPGNVLKRLGIKKQ